MRPRSIKARMAHGSILRCVGELTDGHEIGICNRPDIVGSEREKGAGPTGSRNELDFETIRLIDFNNRPKITELEPVLGKVAIENYRI